MPVLGFSITRVNTEKKLTLVVPKAPTLYEHGFGGTVSTPAGP